MIKTQLLVFLLRTAVSVFGMWLCIIWFGQVDGPRDAMFFVLAGVLFSLANSVVKPLVKLITLPLAAITMGVSTVLLNIAMMALVIYILPGVSMGFWGVAFSALILALINSVANYLMPDFSQKFHSA